MKHQEISKVLSNDKVAPEHFKITLAAPKISREAQAGQFVMIRTSNTTDPLLRRPISFHKIDPIKGTIDILFRVIGKGTRSLSEVTPGDDLDIIGPLGNGFTIDRTKQIALIVGGGAGIAPMLALAELAARKDKSAHVFIGANNINQVLCEDDFKLLGCNVTVTTDDGTYGKKGLITEVLIEEIKSKLASNNAVIYACGPKPMIKELGNISTRHKIPCQVSLEEWMACGIGACFGCTIKTKQGYNKVCSDGPVFNAEDLIW